MEREGTDPPPSGFETRPETASLWQRMAPPSTTRQQGQRAAWVFQWRASATRCRSAMATLAGNWDALPPPSLPTPFAATSAREQVPSAVGVGDRRTGWDMVGIWMMKIKREAVSGSTQWVRQKCSSSRPLLPQNGGFSVSHRPLTNRHVTNLHPPPSPLPNRHAHVLFSRVSLQTPPLQTVPPTNISPPQPCPPQNPAHFDQAEPHRPHRSVC